MFINNGELELTPDNTYIVSYPNDLMDGVLCDFEDNYAFISAHTPGYDQLLDQLDKEGVGWFSIEDFDPSEPPHSWVLQSLGRLIVHDCEELLDES